MSVIDEIAAERKRQIEVEEWTAAHDDEHLSGDLARAAACYAVANSGLIVKLWPWDSYWWKPGAIRRNLIKAGALIVAEIERLDRQTERETRNV